MDHEELLKNIPIFSGVDRRHLSRLSKRLAPRSFKAGDVIVKEKDQATSVFVIVSGRVEVVRGAEGSNPEVLATLGAGEFFGEMALFEGYARWATVQAIEDTECLAMTRWDFVAELREEPEIAIAMLAVLVRRLRDTDARLSE